MAKLKSLFKYNGTFKGVTVVRSRAWGEHIRNKRGTHKPATINNAMQKSGELIKVANGFAKAVKDAVDPYRKDLQDATVWYRLVSLFRLQLGDKGYVDFQELEGFKFHPRYTLLNLLSRNIEAHRSETSDKMLEVTASTKPYTKIQKEKEDSYRQTIIVIFYDPDFEANVLEESVIFPLVAGKTHEQTVRFDIPEDSTLAVIALKCDFYKDGKSVDSPTRRAMEIVKVVEV